MTAETAPRKSIVDLVLGNWKLAVLALLALVIVAIAVAEYAASQPNFFQRYSDYEGSYGTLAASAHKGLACAECHVDASAKAQYDWALVGDFYAGMFGKPIAPTFVKFGAPTSSSCIRCHDEAWSTDASATAKVPHPAHLRVMGETRDCSTCHRWIGHEETYMQQHKQMPFSVVCASFQCHVGVKPAEDCKNCHHQLQPSLDDWKKTHPQTVQAIGPNACVEKCHKPEQCVQCHTTGKTPQLPGVINASTVSEIEQAHVKKGWLTQHGTFALRDESKCLTCHVTKQECNDCHSHRPPFHGTDNTAWIGTGHEPLGKVSKARCLECHKADQCNTCHKTFGAKIPPISQNATP